MNAFIAQTDRPSLDLGERESIYQPENKDLIFPEIPEFKNVAQERQYHKERLVAACRAFPIVRPAPLTAVSTTFACDTESGDALSYTSVSE